MSGPYNAGQPASRTVLVNPDGTDYSAAGGGTGALAAQVQGNVAIDAPSTGNPVFVGGTGTNGVQTAVSANGDRTSFATNLNGALVICAGSGGQDAGGNGMTLVASFPTRLGTSAVNVPTLVANTLKNGAGTWDCQPGDDNGAVTQPHALTGRRFQYASPTGGLTDTTSTQIAASAGVGVRNYLTALQFANTGVASEIVILDGAAVIWRGYAAATTGAMTTIAFAVPLKGSAATAMNVQMVTTASATRISAQGFTGV